MLRSYKQISHKIAEIHKFSSYIICDYWCKAEEEYSILFPQKYASIFKMLPVLRKELIRIYQLCVGLSPIEKMQIILAFHGQNKIKELCNAKICTPDLNQLPRIVEIEMKPFLIALYEEYSERKTLINLYSTKQQYYSDLIEANRFQFCPSCGIVRIFAHDFDHREDFDHYLPKSEFPFTSVNFENLVPICKYCNTTFKTDKNPIENGRKAFYPYLGIDNQISIKPVFGLDISDKINVVEFSGVQQEEINTWNDIFAANARYASVCNALKQEIIDRVKKRAREYKEPVEDSLNFYKQEYEYDKYIDCNFLKIPIIEECLSKKTLLEQLNKN